MRSIPDGPRAVVLSGQRETPGHSRETTKGEPLYNVTADTGVTHTLWIVTNAAHIAELTRPWTPCQRFTLPMAPSLGGASRWLRPAWKSRHRQSGIFLSVMFPPRSDAHFDYNRVIADLNGLSADAVPGEDQREFHP